MPSQIASPQRTVIIRHLPLDIADHTITTRTAQTSTAYTIFRKRKIIQIVPNLSVTSAPLCMQPLPGSTGPRAQDGHSGSTHSYAWAHCSRRGPKDVLLLGLLLFTAPVAACTRDSRVNISKTRTGKENENIKNQSTYPVKPHTLSAFKFPCTL